MIEDSLRNKDSIKTEKQAQIEIQIGRIIGVGKRWSWRLIQWWGGCVNTSFLVSGADMLMLQFSSLNKLRTARCVYS